MRIQRPLGELAASFDHEYKEAVQVELGMLTAGESCSFDQVRTRLGLSDRQLPDGVIHQIALDAGSLVR
jgi:hypothetical protein